MGHIGVFHPLTNLLLTSWDHPSILPKSSSHNVWGVSSDPLASRGSNLTPKKMAWRILKGKNNHWSTIAFFWWFLYFQLREITKEIHLFWCICFLDSHHFEQIPDFETTDSFGLSFFWTMTTDSQYRLRNQLLKGFKRYSSKLTKNSVISVIDMRFHSHPGTSSHTSEDGWMSRGVEGVVMCFTTLYHLDLPSTQKQSTRIMTSVKGLPLESWAGH